MERLTGFRSKALLVLFVVLLSFFALRLYHLQVVEEKADNTTTFTTMTRVKAARGEIRDKNGNVLVGNRASYDIVINHYVLQNANNTNERILELVKLCQTLGIDYIDHFPMTKTEPFTYTLDDYNTAWQGYFRKYLQSRGGGLDSDITAPLLLRRLRSSYNIPEEWSDEDARLVLGIRYELTLRNQTNLSTYIFIEDASNEERSAILELGTPGLNVEASMVREYHTEYAAHILGYVGAMSPKQWEYYKNIDGYLMDAEVGQSGFEEAFEDYLHGIDGWRIDTVSADGTLLSSKYDPEPQAGNHVEVTIDINLQMAAEDSLARKMQSLKDDPAVGDSAGGAVVVMKVDTGEVLVCASYPTYNPAELFTRYEEIASTPYGPLNNRALQFAYPPGSVYKMVTTIAAMDSGLIERDTKIEDKGVFTKYVGFSPRCMLWTHSQKTHGLINAEWALCVSCNYFFYELADQMPLSTLDNTAKGLGLGEPTGVELPENIGYRANKETKEKLYEGDYQQWLQGDMILASIGQSDNQFTPLQLCVYTTTLANKGLRYKATFLNRVVSTDYRQLVFQNEPIIQSQFEISDEAYETYVSGMHMVTYEHLGTASAVFISYPIQVACKTGTAQTGTTGAPDNGAFVLFAPYDEPEIAIALYGERCISGGYISSIAADIMDVYFVDNSKGNVNTYENQIS